MCADTHPFLHVCANDIQDLFTKKINKRLRLSVLLRTLIHSTTTQGLSKIDFPGNDDAENPGWDGFLEARSSTPWIPLGTSGWEFGVSKDVNKKANADFEKSLKAVHEEDKVNTTFVFVTPRRWRGKNDWAKEKKKLKIWKDVRAYDASDLEQWIEQSHTARIWFLNESGRPHAGVRVLEQCWRDWASVTTLELHPCLFEESIKKSKEKIEDFLSSKSTKPLSVAADSIEEALAFLSQALADPKLEQYKDRTLVFDKPNLLSQFALDHKEVIAIVHTRDVERELGPYGSLKSIIVYPRNVEIVNKKNQIIVQPLSCMAFVSAMETMGETNLDTIANLANESGRSLTVLRRRLSNILALRRPIWAENLQDPEQFVAFVFIGVWDVRSEVDRKVLSRMAGDVPLEKMERYFNDLLRLDDSPVWSIRRKQGVVSKIDLLFIMAPVITCSDLDRFFSIARDVLNEDDPALNVPKTSYTGVGIDSVQRILYKNLRPTIANTLVLLAVHYKTLFGNRIDFNGEDKAAELVRNVLEPISIKNLKANQGELLCYADAAPNAFLNIFEDDLKTEKPTIIGLLKPINIQSLCPNHARIELLNALERLAENPSTFFRAAMILARLSEVEIKDEVTNKPFGSLSCVLYGESLSQTLVNNQERINVISRILDKFPTIGWRLCLRAMYVCKEPYLIFHTLRPKWRLNGKNLRKTSIIEETPKALAQTVVNIALHRPFYTVDMLCDLVSKFCILVPNNQKRVLEIIRNGYTKFASNEEEVAKLREQIHSAIATKRDLIRNNKKKWTFLLKKAKEISAAMQVKDLINKYKMVFNLSVVQYFGHDYTPKEEEKLQELRGEALAEIVKEKNIAGIFELAQKVRFQDAIGEAIVAYNILNDHQITNVIFQCLSSEHNIPALNQIMVGATRKLSRDRCKAVYNSLESKIAEEQQLRFLYSWPYCKSTWEFVDQLSEDMRTRYWANVPPNFVVLQHSIENASRLLAAKTTLCGFQMDKYTQKSSSLLACRTIIRYG